jgi:hypothetical protein
MHHLALYLCAECSSQLLVLISCPQSFILLFIQKRKIRGDRVVWGPASDVSDFAYNLIFTVYFSYYIEVFGSALLSMRIRIRAQHFRLVRIRIHFRIPDLMTKNCKFYS